MVSLQDSNHDDRTTSDNGVNITVFYESYCPDSIRFITKQLYPSWMAINSTTTTNYDGIKLNLELIPFGKADVSCVINKWFSPLLTIFFFFIFKVTENAASKLTRGII